jgi:hypothetical protein
MPAHTLRPGFLRATAGLTATVALLALGVASGASGSSAARAADAHSSPRVVLATYRHGVRKVGDLRVGPLGVAGSVSTLDEVRGAWGSERTLRNCVAGWGTGVKLLFTTFGGPLPCHRQFLQIATVTGKAWKVRIRGVDYPIGMRKDELPASAKRIAGWQGGGYELATEPFGNEPITTVMAHVNRKDRVDRFVIWIGGAGD